jgi:hypothetical protein
MVVIDLIFHVFWVPCNQSFVIVLLTVRLDRNIEIFFQNDINKLALLIVNENYERGSVTLNSQQNIVFEHEILIIFRNKVTIDDFLIDVDTLVTENGRNREKAQQLALGTQFGRILQ